MKKRITKVTTKTGDDGTTRMADGTRKNKSDDLLNTIGELDELNSWMGKIISLEEIKVDKQVLIDIQHCLFEIGGSLSTGAEGSLTLDDIEALEVAINTYNTKLPELDNFILPGGHKSSADIHITRAVCRRCERSMVEIKDSNNLSKNNLIYINRLSDFLFILARTVNLRESVREHTWNQRN